MLVGPEDGGPGDQAFASSTVGSGPLSPPTALPPLATASNVVFITSAWLPTPDASPWPSGFVLTSPIGTVLELSNLTQADLSAGTSFTLLLMGDSRLPATVPDGGPNPLFLNFRLIRNDAP
jgi:hypothetical protein